MPGFWDRLDEKMQENAAGILGTIAFHLVLISIFLVAKISNEKKLMRDMILIDFVEEVIEEQIDLEEPDPEFEELLANYLEENKSNVPVNLATQVDQEISTDKYVQELENDLNANRPDEWKETEERLKELEELANEEISMEAEESEQSPPEPYDGPTNIYYKLEYRYHRILPVPVYKCQGSGVVVVNIVVDQQGRVVQTETEKPGETANEICLADAAKSAAMKTRFNRDLDAPVRQTGSITYHFIAQ
jgi:hypothetical protein